MNSSLNTIQPDHVVSPAGRAAIRKVPTKAMDHDQWLQARNEGIGASESATAAGLNPFQSQLELWMLKTGRIEPTPEAPIDQMRSPMYWGQVLEPVVAQHYTRLTGRKVRRVNAILQHPDYPWMLANLDYSVVASDEVQILECKTAGEYGAKHWKSGPPDYVHCQVQHQLAVTGKQAADVGVLICGQEFRVYRVERDDELIAQLIALEHQFWQQVISDTPPEADASESARFALNQLYPGDSGERVDWSEDVEMNQTFDQLLQVRGRLDQLKTEETALKHRLQQAMAEASEAILAQGKISFKRSQDQVTLNTKALLNDQPDLLAQYPLKKAGSRRFLVRV
ncbi:YqaJ viral recombinase family nuclease [Oceanospirillum sediminis]|nr:YqaJ viral recombinase family protein [Oceanospirillum sediminis]